MELENFVTDHEIGSDADSGSGLRPLSAEEMRKRSVAARYVLEEHVEENPGVDWAASYHKLINAGWPWRIAAWVAWSTVPKSLRWPKTQNELATEVLGLTSDRTIATWRKKFPTLDQLIADLQADEMLDARADVLNALKLSASNVDYKSHQDRKLYLEITGDYVPAARWLDELQKSTGDGMKGKSDAELERMIPQKDKAVLPEEGSDEE
jgi:hypothetical protein